VKILCTTSRKKTLALSSGWFVIFLLYRWAYDGTLTLDGIHGAFSGTACILIGMSLGLSSTVHFLRLPRRYLTYRRVLGITGYLHALTYTIVLFLRSKEQYLADFPAYLLTVPAMLGFFSMAILTLMALSSNNAAVTLFGVRYWKKIMRLGYAAYAALVIRAAWTDGDDWFAWLASPAGLPPPRLVLSVFASICIVARLAMSMPCIITGMTRHRLN